MAVYAPKETPMKRSAKLIFVLGLAFAAASTGCVVRGRAHGHVGVSTTPVVVYQEPPPDQVETVTVRPGYVWVRGRWDWRGGQWVWIGGRWERERANYTWSPGRWERRGSSWHWVEGNWVAGGSATVTSGPGPNPAGQPGGVTVHGGGHVHGGGGGPVVRDHRDPAGAPGGVVVNGGGGGSVVVDARPRQPPPAPRTESFGAPRDGYVWISGRWDWRNGQWAWVDGHWERKRANMVWNPGRWENQGGYYVWIEGSWGPGQPAQQGPVIRDHRR